MCPEREALVPSNLHMSAVSEILKPTSEFAGERRETFLLSFQSDHIGATLHRPACDPRSAVLLLPGWSGPRTGPAEVLVFLARKLAADGHLVLRIDFHGRGDATGRFIECDLDRMIAEASVGLDRLREEAPGVSIVVGGICSGANVALGLASLRPGDVAVALAFSVLPYQPSRGASFEHRRRWKNIKQYAAKAVKPGTWLKLIRGDVNLERVKKNVTASEKTGGGERNLKDSSRDIEKELLSWKGRSLFVWGGGDEEGAPSRTHFEKLHADGCANEAQFETIPGANHNFYGRSWRERLTSLTLAFLGK